MHANIHSRSASGEDEQPTAGPADTIPGGAAAAANADRAIPYVARILQQHLVDNASSRYWTAEGTAVFVDISGFTKLSERLARKGREGAEQITEAIGRQFRGDPGRRVRERWKPAQVRR